MGWLHLIPVNVSDNRRMLRGWRSPRGANTSSGCAMRFGTFVKHDAKLIDRLAERAQINSRYSI